MTKTYRVAVLTASDRSATGSRPDLSGPAITDMLAAVPELSVTYQKILPDDQEGLAAEMAALADQSAVELILTTGGTGLAPRDQMPEATLSIAHRMVPGIAEALRYNSLQITKRGMLSRGVSVIRNQTLIINLPGSPKAVRESLEYLLDQLPHALGLLTDTAGEKDNHR